MKSRKFRALISVCWVCAAPAVWAERADRDAPMVIEADALRHDDARQISVFTGHVRIVKGSIRIRGERVEVHQDAQGYQYGLASGSAAERAYYAQKREGLDETIEGEADTLDYDGRADRVLLSGHAQLRRLRGASLADRFEGERIRYDNVTEVFTLDAQPASPLASATAGLSQPVGRVKVMLSPAVQAADPASTPPASAATSASAARPAAAPRAGTSAPRRSSAQAQP